MRRPLLLASTTSRPAGLMLAAPISSSTAMDRVRSKVELSKADAGPAAAAAMAGGDVSRRVWVVQESLTAAGAWAAWPLWCCSSVQARRAVTVPRHATWMPAPPNCLPHCPSDCLPSPASSTAQFAKVKSLASTPRDKPTCPLLQPPSEPLATTPLSPAPHLSFLTAPPAMSLPKRIIKETERLVNEP